MFFHVVGESVFEHKILGHHCMSQKDYYTVSVRVVNLFQHVGNQLFLGYKSCQYTFLYQIVYIRVRWFVVFCVFLMFSWGLLFKDVIK